MWPKRYEPEQKGKKRTLLKPTHKLNANPRKRYDDADKIKRSEHELTSTHDTHPHYARKCMRIKLFLMLHCANDSIDELHTIHANTTRNIVLLRLCSTCVSLCTWINWHCFKPIYSIHNRYLMHPKWKFHIHFKWWIEMNWGNSKWNSHWFNSNDLQIAITCTGILYHKCHSSSSQQEVFDLFRNAQSKWKTPSNRRILNVFY